MDPIIVRQDSPCVKVFAAQARGERVDSLQAEKAQAVVDALREDFSPHNRHQFAQVIGFGVNELQQNALNFLDVFADQKRIDYQQKAVFDVQTRGVLAQIQAKGSTPTRSYVTDRRVSVETQEVAARVAIHINDVLTGRVQMSRLISEANEAMTIEEVKYVESVLHTAVATFSSPFYGTGTGVVQATLDAMLDYFSDFGPVAIIGASSGLRALAGLSGYLLDAGNAHYSDDMINVRNANGHLGVYNTAELIKLQNAYYPGTTTKILNDNWLYIVPGGYTGDTRNLKVVWEGNVRSYERQDPDDETLETTLRQWFGAAFVTNERTPNIGAYLIG